MQSPVLTSLNEVHSCYRGWLLSRGGIQAGEPNPAPPVNRLPSARSLPDVLPLFPNLAIHLPDHLCHPNMLLKFVPASNCSLLVRVPHSLICVSLQSSQSIRSCVLLLAYQYD